MLMRNFRDVEDQLNEQNRWNDDIIRGMETMKDGYQEISALREESAMLKEEVAMLRDQLKSLTKDSSGTARRPGRPRVPKRVQDESRDSEE